jgi:hypothetical protein
VFWNSVGSRHARRPDSLKQGPDRRASGASLWSPVRPAAHRVSQRGRITLYTNCVPAEHRRTTISPDCDSLHTFTPFTARPRGCSRTATFPAHPSRRAIQARRRITMKFVALVMLGSIALYLLQQFEDFRS